MHADIKEIVGVLMRVLDGGEVEEDELADLAFEAEGELETALNAAYVQLGEFAAAADARREDPATDQQMREELQACLDEIVRICDAEEPPPRKH
jgi:hypothetical protein